MRKDRYAIPVYKRKPDGSFELVRVHRSGLTLFQAETVANRLNDVTFKHTNLYAGIEKESY